MITLKSVYIRKNLSIKFIFVILMVFLPLSASCQSSSDFSGNWLQDNEKSDAQYQGYNVKLTIAQTLQTITITQTFSDKEGKEITSGSESYNLDGKEVEKEEYGAVNKESASWSPDKKVLTTKVSRTNAGEVFGSTTSYSLSDDGLVLTLKTDNIKPGQASLIQVLNKTP